MGLYLGGQVAGPALSLVVSLGRGIYVGKSAQTAAKSNSGGVLASNPRSAWTAQ